MFSIIYIGYLATGFNAISQIPQVITTFQKDDLDGVSLTSYILLFLSQILWFIYAINTKSTPLMISAFLMGIFCFVIIIQVFVKK